MNTTTSTTNQPVFDYTIVGSGFGGSVSAMRLSEKGYSVLVLERGRRYRTEDIPERDWDLRKFLWLPAARLFGMWGLNILDDILILSGNGVGGGSLIYAATHLKPDKSFFEAREWRDLASWETELAPHYATAEKMLGVTTNPRFGPADHILHEIAAELGQEHTFQPTPVAIYFGEPGVTAPDPFFGGEGPARAGCIFCGGCIVGCRHNAKNSLDKNYLYFAEKFGAEVRAEANVLDIRPLPGQQPDGARYELIYERVADWFVKRKVSVRCRNVIVSAGVLGTVNLLLRCRDDNGSLPRLSKHLGRHVRSNSEALIGSTARHGDVDYSEGIAISSHFWIDDVTSVEPVRYPRGSSVMRALSAPLVDLQGGTWRRLGRFVLEGFRAPYDFMKSRLLPNWARDTTILLIMQKIDNRMHLERGRSLYTLYRRGLVSQQDFHLPIPAVIEAGRQVLSRFTAKTDGIPGAFVTEILLDKPSTAHILGGCTIGADETKGVVDASQQVFNYPGLYVADASVIPANLGVNPSLTITAMTERAMSLISPAGEVEFLPLPASVVPEKSEESLAGRAMHPGVPYLLLALLLSVIMWALWRRQS